MSEEIRPPSKFLPNGAALDPGLVARITESLNAIPDRTIAAIIQVPVSEDGKRVLKGQLFVNVGHGLSFSTWLDHDLDVQSNLGWGVIARKTF